MGYQKRSSSFIIIIAVLLSCGFLQATLCCCCCCCCASFASYSRNVSCSIKLHQLQNNKNNHHHRQWLFCLRGGEHSSSLSLSSSSGSKHRLFGSNINGDSKFGSGDEEDLIDDGRKKEQTSTSSSSGIPATGWTHNQPGPNSKFWTSPELSSPSTRRTTATTTSSSSNKEEEPRTGWLHNTKPRTDDTSSSSKKKTTTTMMKAKESEAQRLLRLEKQKVMTNHRILSPPTFHPVAEGRRAVVTEHAISVPIDNIHHDNSESNHRIDIYFSITELITSELDETFFQSMLTIINDARSRAIAYVQHANLSNADSMILYLQGGPGFGCPTPFSSIGLSEKSSWLGAALSNKGFRRVVLMDQRGTGRSTPITKQTLQRRFPDLFALDDVVATTTAHGTSSSTTDKNENNTDPLEFWKASHPDLAARVEVALGHATEFMTKFRADRIVRDAEAVKDALLLPPSSSNEQGRRPWGAALGQSFGGFCLMSYLSFIPNPPKICLFTGGIGPMMTKSAYHVYEKLWNRVKERNLKYYQQYPSDIQLVKRIVRHLLNERIILPSGGILTARRFLQLGIVLGGSPSSFTSLHSLLVSAIVDSSQSSSSSSSSAEENNNNSVELSRAFLKAMDSNQPYDDNPIYFLLHESIYANGASTTSPTNWAAHRALEARNQQQKTSSSSSNEFQYDLTSTSHDNNNSDPTLFYGEMIFPWMTEGDYAELSGFGMKALAQSLAIKDNWEPLYDKKAMRAALSSSHNNNDNDNDTTTTTTTIPKCRAAAAVYYDDMYVDFDECMKVTASGGNDDNDDDSGGPPLELCKVWITNEYQHSGLRDDGANIFSRLLGMARGSIGIPS